MTDLAPADTRTPRTVCPRCGVRLVVDGLDLCMQCHDRQAMGRQTTLGQVTLR